MNRSMVSVCLLVVVALGSTRCWAQATVNEGLETAFLWVDTNSGSDTNPGTQQKPLKTIGAATSIANNNKNNSIGTQININPGTYRESITLSSSPNTTNYPITIQAVTAGSVIVSGSVVYTGWSAYSGNASIYTTTWNNNWGLCPQLTGCTYQPDIMMRQEMMVVNGTPLTQVLSQTLMQPGTFYVDTVGNMAYIWPAAGTNMSTATVEVATLPTLLSLFNMSDIVIRGIVFQYANTCHASAAVQVDGSTNVLIDNDIFQWNNAQGLAINNPTTYFTVQYSQALHNGDAGFQEGQTNYGLWQNDVSSYNNWRGAQGGYYDCNIAGLHAWLVHHDTINNLTVSFNQAWGVHWDTDAYNVSFTGGTVTNNMMSGLFVEKSEGPVSFSNSYVCNQNMTQALGGLQLRNSEDVSLTGSVLSNNAAGEIYFTGQAGGVSVTNWETGQQYNLVTSYLTMSGNTILANDATQSVFSDGYLSGSDWTTFQTTLNSGSNTWWNPATTAAFTVPSPADWTGDTLATWQGATGQDSSSTFSAPTGNPAGACTLAPSGSDFWFTVDNGTLSTDPTGHATFNLTMTPLNFTGTANLVLDGIAEVNGLSATLSPTSLTDSGTSVLTVAAASTTAAGTYPITVLATSGSTTRTVTAQLTVPVTSLYFSSVNLNLGSVQINTTGGSQSFTITNTGKSWVGITSIVSNSSAFPQTNTCATGLAAGKACTVTVSFAPWATGLMTSTITVTDKDATSPQTVNLSGTGLAAPSVSFAPSPVAFANTEVGYTSSPFTVTITNTAPSTAALLTISSIAVTGSKASDYAITSNTCPLSPSTLASGASCNVTLTFSPAASGSRNATLTVYDNTGGDNQDNDSLTGTGILPTTGFAPSALAFASQIPGTTSPSQTVTYTNTSSSAVLNISSIALGGAYPGDYAQTNTCPASLAAGASCTITVTFTPTGTGNHNANVKITSNSGSSPDKVTFSGTGAYPTSSFTPSPLAFGNQQIGYTSPSQTATFTNTAAVPLTINSIALTGSHPGDYTQTNTCPTTVAAGASCSITVSFTPGSSGTRDAKLTVYDNESSGSSTDNLTGAGVYPTSSLSPSTLAFGNQEVGYKSAGITTTLTNTSSWTLTISSIKLTGSKPGDYSQTTTCPGTLAANASCTVTVWFTPGSSGSRDATLTVNDDVSGGTTTASLTGSGVLPTAKVSPASDNFGSVTKGKTSSGIISTLTNTSTNGSVLAIASITVTGTNKKDYSQTNNCPSSLAVNATCTITVTFTPSATGTRTASVTITDNVSAGSQAISLTGTGK